MKNFSSSEEESAQSLDLSSLETNSKFNATTSEDGQPPAEGENTEAIKPTENINTGEGSNNSEPSNISEGGEPSESSLNTNNEPEQPNAIEFTDEQLFKNLSEKLGREITTYDDLSQNTLELDEEVKAINEWKEKTGRPIEDFFKYQKDYSEVSDLEIAREFLQIEYPTFTKEEIELELGNLAPSEDDYEDDAAKKALELKKIAIKGREVLETYKADLSKPSTSNLAPEIKQKLDFAEDIKKQIEDSEGQQKEYLDNISKIALTTESLNLKLSDDLNLDFKMSEEDRKEIPNLINEMPHWRNSDGSWNHKAVVEDAIKIKHFDSMLKLAYEQGQSSGKDNIIKDAKNSTLGNPQGAEQGTGKRKPIIEGIDKLLGKQTMKTRFGK